MSTNKDNPTDADISNLYRTTQNDGPDAALDAAILAQAEAATKPKTRRPAWIAPVGLAATVLLGVNLAMNLKDYSSKPDIYAESSAVLGARNPEHSADPEKIERLPGAGEERDSQVRLASRMNREKLTRSDSNRPLASPDGERSTNEPAFSNAGAAAAQPAPLPEPPAAVAESLNDSIARQRLAINTEDRPDAERDLFEVVGTKEAVPPEQALVADSRAASEMNARVRAPVRAPVFAAREAQQPAADESANSVNTESAKQEPAPVQAAASAATTDGVSPRPAASIADLAPPADSTDDDAQLDQAVETGARVPESSTSPHPRLDAKNQAKRTPFRITGSYLGDENIEPGSSAAPYQAAGTKLYFCDLVALNIDKDTVELAKVEARSFEPPLNAVTWPDYIRELAQSQDYAMACAQLAAYYQLFPNVALITPLPVVLPPEK